MQAPPIAGGAADVVLSGGRRHAARHSASGVYQPRTDSCRSRGPPVEWEAIARPSINPLSANEHYRTPEGREPHAGEMTPCCGRCWRPIRPPHGRRNSPSTGSCTKRSTRIRRSSAAACRGERRRRVTHIRTCSGDSLPNIIGMEPFEDGAPRTVARPKGHGARSWPSRLFRGRDRHVDQSDSGYG